MAWTDTSLTALRDDGLARAIDAAARAVPPLWPLNASVAVNPFLGQAQSGLADTGVRLARVAGADVTMPRAWYRARIGTGAITDEDLADALAASPQAGRPRDLAALRRATEDDTPPPSPLPTVADLAAEVSGTDWPGLVAERLGAWAAAHFDEGQALWAAPRETSAYRAWRAVAIRDLTPEIAGLPGFARHVADAPERAEEAVARAAGRLGLGDAALEAYFHRLLMTLGGWSQYARYRLWVAELSSRTDTTLTDLLAIRLVWEETLFQRYGEALAAAWETAQAAYADADRPTPDLVVDAILQEAAERADQRALAAVLDSPAPARPQGRPAVQAAFCIDVRSERFRRALESVDPRIRTSGFAGFFGIPVEHQGFASDVGERRLPVLLQPGVRSRSGGAEDAADRSSRFARRARRAWGRFKLAAVSSFALVEASGPLYAGKLLRDALGLGPASRPDGPPPRFDPPLAIEARVDMAEKILRAMSLTGDFARVVVLAGHGAAVVNNPHASALQCGACGGHSGEVNVRLLATLLNSAEVRQGLANRQIRIPQDTLFVGALHDTTTDAVVLYEQDHVPPEHEQDLERLKGWLAAAGKATRAERALCLPRAAGEACLHGRGRNWAEVRPEWGLAGCRAFIAAPRGRTTGRHLEGRAFLHDYDWQQDKDFGVLELILTAPVVVASWISLQYYGSAVAPEVFGAGNKLLHNVTGGIGVVEGNGGLLRGGLPWQSVHDGETLVHEPLRLSVCIEAPREAMSAVLKRHEDVRALFDHRWLHLFALDDTGRMAWRYAGDLGWEPFAATGVAVEEEFAACGA
ncbi:YbcC family protein [Jiella sp. M17.18]|uniref:YbcC family protein n=1 Tax=Jiella sp. M17.18 TaxID=3234247 RepID=UPI0034DEDDC1